MHDICFFTRLHINRIYVYVIDMKLLRIEQIVSPACIVIRSQQNFASFIRIFSAVVSTAYILMLGSLSLLYFLYNLTAYIVAVQYMSHLILMMHAVHCATVLSAAAASCDPHGNM